MLWVHMLVSKLEISTAFVMREHIASVRFACLHLNDWAHVCQCAAPAYTQQSLVHLYTQSLNPHCVCDARTHSVCHACVHAFAWLCPCLHVHSTCSCSEIIHRILHCVCDGSMHSIWSACVYAFAWLCPCPHVHNTCSFSAIIGASIHTKFMHQ